jgi:hypothetical protein
LSPKERAEAVVAAARGKGSIAKKADSGSTNEKPASSKKQEKPKLPRALSAYNFFMQERAKKSTDGSRATLTDLAAEWKQLSAADRAPYEALAADSKQASAAARDAAKSAAKAAQGPQSAYQQFTAQFITASRAAGQTVGIKEAAAAWKALPESERAARSAEAQRQRAAWAATHKAA